jgi:hypothetical protein
MVALTRTPHCTYDAQLVAVRDIARGHTHFPFPANDYLCSMEAIDKVRTAFPPVTG